MSIPNLDQFRRIGRGRGGRQSTGRPHHDHDAIVRGTDDDAASSRMSAVQAGYLDDPFAQYLSNRVWQRRLPLMNRGTYVRTTSIDRVVDQFLQITTERKQIISLGAGSDTRYFRLRARHNDLNLTYHELDFPENSKRKIERLADPGCSHLIHELCGLDLTGHMAKDGENLVTADYQIHSLDLRNFNVDYITSTFDTSAPTLIISECCLVYLDPEAADRVLDMMASTMKESLMIVLYEPIHPDTPFGKVMTRNLVSRGIHLQTVEKYATLEAQIQRLQNSGFDGAEVFDIDTVWQTWVSSDEKSRIDGLEWMDEIEEFTLLAKHYCLAIGYRGMQAPVFAPE